MTLVVLTECLGERGHLRVGWRPGQGRVRERRRGQGPGAPCGNRPLLQSRDTDVLATAAWEPERRLTTSSRNWH